MGPGMSIATAVMSHFRLPVPQKRPIATAAPAPKLARHTPEAQMARVVYFLGAGFSRPLGVPTIANFLEAAKNQQEREPGRYGYFQPLLDRIEGLYKAGTFFESDLTNIEEVLSLLEADAFVDDGKLKREFIKFICDVITFHTPPIERVLPKLPSNWEGLAFGTTDRHWNHYGYFTLALLNLQLGLESSTGKLHVSLEDDPRITYSVVTTNYDLVLENVCDYAKQNFVSGDKAAFRLASGKRVIESGRSALAKLHGSVDDGDVIPPTWSKAATPEYADPWRLALKVLSEAQEIRIIGYSLPESDAYVRFLLKAAAIRSRDLRRVHVLCLDKDNAAGVEKRYQSFVKLRGGFEFRNMDSWQYLNNLLQRLVNSLAGSPAKHLEDTHGFFFRTP